MDGDDNSNIRHNRQPKSVRFSINTSKPEIYKNPSQVETLNEIEEKLHDKTENDMIDTNSSDVDLSFEDSDF